jgi:small subunit ribosomal protein S8
MVTDSIADLLTRIRNAQRAGHKSARIPASKMVERVLGILKSEGLIEGYDSKQEEGKPYKTLNIWLKYYENGEPVISLARRISKSGQRIYARADELPRVQGGLGISIVSTSHGVMSDREARKKKIGGEVLALVG